MTNETIEVLKEMGNDIKNGLFTKDGLKRQWLFFTNQEEWERTDKYLKTNFCTTCNHHEKHHKDEKYSSISRGYCRQCWKENKRNCGHEFNKKESELRYAVGKVISSSTMIHEDDYRIYIYCTKLTKEQLDNLESFFGFKITDINHLNPNNFYGNSKYRIVACTTKIFCRYCDQPFKTKLEKLEHEQKSDGFSRCYRKPDEVTFADMFQSQHFNDSVRIEK